MGSPKVRVRDAAPTYLLSLTFVRCGKKDASCLRCIASRATCIVDPFSLWDAPIFCFLERPRKGERRREEEKDAHLCCTRDSISFWNFSFFLPDCIILGFYTKLEKKKFNAFVRMTDKFRSFACYKSKYWSIIIHRVFRIIIIDYNISEVYIYI